MICYHFKLAYLSNKPYGFLYHICFQKVSLIITDLLSTQPGKKKKRSGFNSLFGPNPWIPV